MSLTRYTSNPKSGSGTAGATQDSVFDLGGETENDCNGVVHIQVASSEAAGVEVIAAGDTVGILVANDGVAVPFFCDDLKKIEIKRQGASDITFRYFAF